MRVESRFGRAALGARSVRPGGRETLNGGLETGNENGNPETAAHVAQG